MVGSVQTALFALQQRVLRQQQAGSIDASLVTFLLRYYTAERLDDWTSAGRLVRNPRVRDYFDDVIVTSGQPPVSGVVYLNPRGAVHRDPDLFPQQEILDGLQRARHADGLVQAASGFCFAVKLEDRVAGYIWFQPRRRDGPFLALPFWAWLLAISTGTLLFGMLLYWTVMRTIARPLQSVGAAAREVGAGVYGARLPAWQGVPEIEELVRSFNAMAAKVEGHTAELQKAVELAVAEAKQKERALVLSSRLATVGTLAAGIAHEINNPIGGMLNAVHRLLQDQQLTSRQRSYLELVQGGLQRIAGIARKVLDFSPRQVEAQPFELRRAVDGACALVEHRLQHRPVQLEVDLPEGLPPVLGDISEIQQVVLNLLLNSLDALGDRKGRIRISAAPAGDQIRLTVEDDGPGMDPADLPRVMDPFFSRKDRPDASGLGMFISFSIVRNHGGEMSVDSAPGQGFRTVLTLPAVRPGRASDPGRGATGAAGRPWPGRHGWS